jgi:hypothetical protein
VDAIGFIRLETYVTGDGDVKKAFSDGTRQMVCHAMAANVSKNRFGITEPIALELGVTHLLSTCQKTLNLRRMT